MTRVRLAAAILSATLAAGGLVAQAGPADEQARIDAILAPLNGEYGVSDAAMATAVLGADGKPVGVTAYAAPVDAIKAGDMAAFIALVRMAGADDDVLRGLGAVVLSVDRIAAQDHVAARALIEAGEGDDYTGPILDFVNAWLYALEDDIPAAIAAHRGADAGLPGLTADLSLAAMLEAAGRVEEALAVYETLTPSRIEAPEHRFDAKGILFSHVKMVVARHALLLRRLNRIEEAQAVYRRLADAEPERATQYAAAIEALETGRGIDDEAVTLRSAFAQSMSDLSNALFQQRYIRNALIGRRLDGFDAQRATFDQLALLVDPASRSLRQTVMAGLYEEALFDGVAHVAQTAPEPNAALQLSAAQALLMAGEDAKAASALEAALELAGEDERYETASGAVSLYALLGNDARALGLAAEARSLAVNGSERASAAGLTASVHQQFARPDEAVRLAREAVALDNTHERRMALATYLAESGAVEEGLALIRADRLSRPNDPYMLNTLGYFLIEHTDRYQEGFRVLYRANELAPNDAYIADSLGWAYYRLGHLDDASRLLKISRDELLPHRHWEIEDHLGDVLWHLGDEAAARAAWQVALDGHPPVNKRARMTDKLENGISEPAPETQKLPRVSSDEQAVEERDI